MNSAAHNPLGAADYLATLGLQQHPYLDSNDARFFYADPSLIQRLDLLQHLTQFGDMLLGVTGPVGSGKTCMAQQFLLRGNTTWRSCHIHGTQIQQPGELLTKLADCFGLQAAGTPERLKADLLRHCQGLRHNAQLAVVVIDDAQRLPDAALKALLELADDPRETLKLLRVILFSEPGLEPRLAAAGWHSPQQPLLHSLDLPRFDEQQTAAYLMYRLAAAGYSGECPFSLTEIRALHKSAAGLPGKLNVLAHEILMENASRIATRKKLAAPGPRRIHPVVALGLAGTLVAGGLAWYLSQKQATQQEPLAPLASAPLATPAPSPKPTDSNRILPAEPVATPTEEPEKSLETTPEIKQEHDINTKKSDKPMPEPASSAALAVMTEAAQGSANADTARSEPEQTSAQAPETHPALEAASPGTGAANVSTPASIAAPIPRADLATNLPVTPPQLAAPTAAPAESTASAKSAQTPTPALKPEPTEKLPLTATTATTAPAAPTAPPTTPGAALEPTPPATIAPTTPPATTASEQLGTAWLQSRPGAHFTLQLLGGRSEKSLREYLRQNRIAEPVATFRTVHKGGNWYVLVHGDFPTMTAARAAVSTLPATVRKGKPWVRSFATVHADMQKARP